VLELACSSNIAVSTTWAAIQHLSSDRMVT
jgi:hypothetical protein